MTNYDVWNFQHELADARYRSKGGFCDVNKLHNSLGAEITNARTLNEMSSIDLSVFKNLLHTHELLLIRGLELDERKLEFFSSQLGEFLPHIVPKFNSPDFQNVAVLTNARDREGNLKGADRSGMQWHTDGSFRTCPPKYTLLYGDVCPPIGGNTEFCSISQAYIELNDSDKQLLSEMYAEHSYEYYWARHQKARGPLGDEVRSASPPIMHPCVRRHKETDKKTLYLMDCMVRRLQGQDEETSKNTLDRLLSFTKSRDKIYSHQWKAGDLLVWDNRLVMHRATEYNNNHLRRMIRTSILGEAPLPE